MDFADLDENIRNPAELFDTGTIGYVLDVDPQAVEAFYEQAEKLGVTPGELVERLISEIYPEEEYR